MLICGVIIALGLLGTAYVLYYLWKESKNELPPDAPKQLRLREVYKRLGMKQAPGN